ncbi:HPr family phosphocarrier protein [Corynebacterium uterequi]|uniref:Phosphocarrier protein HPr n=1 Tax=Corynebacterium uterequi TaxID=1072256 RepID=A0A0G3HH84_9CORY|nr:HPr family phosphocarrier protein [Corynebacterium uterequi]AKK11288.1 phosphotransferase system HPr (HPr) family protein [Corynebacterium uterequi]
MASTTVTVGSTVGLHARPAALIAEAAAGFDDVVLLHLVGDEGEDDADASSTLMIMAMGARCGDEVTVRSANPLAVKKVAALIAAELS